MSSSHASPSSNNANRASPATPDRLEVSLFNQISQPNTVVFRPAQRSPEMSVQQVKPAINSHFFTPSVSFACVFGDCVTFDHYKSVDTLMCLEFSLLTFSFFFDARSLSYESCNVL